MKLKEIMKSIRMKRQITATGMAIMLGITPSYLSQIENGKCVPHWFIDKLTTSFQLEVREINELKSALDEVYYTAEDNVKKRITKLQHECIGKLYALISSILTQSYDMSRQFHEEIMAILSQIKTYFNKNEELALE